MVGPLQRPPRRDPLKRMTVPTLPPAGPSRAAGLLAQAAAEGRFAIQCCGECGRYAYPARDACSRCLSSDLALRDVPEGGVVLSETTVTATLDAYFRERLPWRIGLVRLDVGPTMVAHLHGDCVEGERVRMSLQIDKSGQAVAFARPGERHENEADDRQWREMTTPVKFRRVLVTNARTEVGRALVLQLAAQGAKVFAGIPELWKPLATRDELNGAAEIVALDAADERSARDLSRDIGGKVDILINTEEFIRPGGLLDRPGASTIREEMDRLYMGFVNLAQAFGPAMRARGADGQNSAGAWVNLLSVYALANWRPFATANAVEAARLSLSHCLRGELRAGGVRMINVFSGPVDTEWYQTVPPPKVAPGALAAGVVAALGNGVEEVFIGDVAREVRQRLLSNPKALERDLSAGNHG